ncbi:hypothetical protein SADUNF_Sadunf07G0107600 [Salix dunnii]|uniref:Uncharacterized protein n=1 Tax=Salix dunnii TaxID=1413687 RepID=A0A835K4C1_9ROSI|nr:hypothetical protein SADUNF_Sadunf07G0107600 [Salix dunnii]
MKTWGESSSMPDYSTESVSLGKACPMMDTALDKRKPEVQAKMSINARHRRKRLPEPQLNLVIGSFMKLEWLVKSKVKGRTNGR